MKSLHACEIVRAGGCLSCRQGNSLPSPGQAIRAPAPSFASARADERSYSGTAPIKGHF
jgi:hypothetical protein